MPFKQQIFALAVSLLVFFFTIEMVRQKRLREEYSVLWLFTSCLMFILVLKYDWLVGITNLVGAVLPTTTLFIASIIFLVLLGPVFHQDFPALGPGKGPGAGERHPAPSLR